MLRVVLREGAAVAFAGVAIGLAAALGVTRGHSSLLFGITAADPAVFSGVAAALIGVALLASLIPAWRASRVNPVTALRGE